MIGFDWHGSLCELVPHHFLDPLNQVLKALGQPSLEGLGQEISVFDTIANAAKHDRRNTQLALHLFKELYKENFISPYNILPGAKETLEFYKSHRIQTFLISNHMEDLLLHDLKRTKLDSYFMHVIGARDINDLKPKTTMFNRFFMSLGAKHDSTIPTYYCGDSVSDIIAAGNAGCQTILVQKRPIYRPLCKPHTWVENISALPKLVNPTLQSTPITFVR